MSDVLKRVWTSQPSSFNNYLLGAGSYEYGEEDGGEYYVTKKSDGSTEIIWTKVPNTLTVPMKVRVGNDFYNRKQFVWQDGIFEVWEGIPSGIPLEEGMVIEESADEIYIVKDLMEDGSYTKYWISSKSLSAGNTGESWGAKFVIDENENTVFITIPTIPDTWMNTLPETSRSYNGHVWTVQTTSLGENCCVFNVNDIPNPLVDGVCVVDSTLNCIVEVVEIDENGDILETICRDFSSVRKEDTVGKVYGAKFHTENITIPGYTSGIAYIFDDDEVPTTLKSGMIGRNNGVLWIVADKSYYADEPGNPGIGTIFDNTKVELYYVEIPEKDSIFPGMKFRIQSKDASASSNKTSTYVHMYATDEYTDDVRLCAYWFWQADQFEGMLINFGNGIFEYRKNPNEDMSDEDRIKPENLISVIISKGPFDYTKIAVDQMGEYDGGIWKCVYSTNAYQPYWLKLPDHLQTVIDFYPTSPLVRGIGHWGENEDGIMYYVGVWPGRPDCFGNVIDEGNLEVVYLTPPAVIKEGMVGDDPNVGPWIIRYFPSCWGNIPGVTVDAVTGERLLHKFWCSFGMQNGNNIQYGDWVFVQYHSTNGKVLTSHDPDDPNYVGNFSDNEIETSPKLGFCAKISTNGWSGLAYYDYEEKQWFLLTGIGVIYLGPVTPKFMRMYRTGKNTIKCWTKSDWGVGADITLVEQNYTLPAGIVN